MFYAAKSGMNAPSKLLLALTAVAALSVAYPARANLITNPGFETGDFTGWTNFHGSAVGTAFGVPPHSGNFQAQFDIQFRSTGQLSQSVATTIGASYTINFFLALANAPPANSFSVMWGGVTVLGSVLTNQSAFGYTEYTFNVTAPTASTELFFQFDGEGAAWLLDDVSVNPAGVGVPDGGSTVSLLGCALLGLAALRRKLGC
jgi:protein with PEP-CTERM/exosortase system signal